MEHEAREQLDTGHRFDMHCHRDAPIAYSVVELSAYSKHRGVKRDNHAGDANHDN